MKLSFRHVLLQTLSWLLFFAIIYLFFCYSLEEVSALSLNTSVIVLSVVSVALLIAFFYVNQQVLLPKMFFGKKYFTYFILVFSFAIILLLMPLLRVKMGDSVSAKGVDLINHVLISSLLFMMVLVVSTIGPVIKRWVEAENSAMELENQRLSAELLFLKSQVNPHFLFNTLNNIYSLSVVSDPLASESILKLSQLLRYLLKDVQSETVAINTEIEHLQQYIDLQKIRLTDKVTVVFDSKVDSAGCRIAPLLMLPFVENSFKYGISTHEKTKIEISLLLSSGVLEFSVKNPVNSGVIADVDSTGIGVENVRKRLALSYPNKFELVIKNTEVFHHVYLKVTGLC